MLSLKATDPLRDLSISVFEILIQETVSESFVLKKECIGSSE